MESTNNQPTCADQKKLQDQIKNLEEKYSSITKQIQMLQEDKNTMNQSIKNIEQGFDRIEQRIIEFTSKIDMSNEKGENKKVFNMFEKRKRMSLISIIKKPIRKLAVGTISTAMAIGEFTSERIALAREGIEDIVAEAHYQSRKNRVNMSTQE